MMNRLYHIVFLLVLLGCSPSVTGLKAIEPKAIYLEATLVDTLTPTLTWEAFPRARDLKPLGADSPDQIRNVSYELKIAVIENHDQELTRAPVIAGLKQPRYRVPSALLPGETYAWTVRARFELNGRPRVTQWSRHSLDTQNPYDIDVMHAFRFRTPKP